MHPPSLEVSNPELSIWLSSLEASIWKDIYYEDKWGVHSAREEARKLTKEEWHIVRGVISSGNVILTLADNFGLVLRVSIWSYPASVFEEESKLLLTITNNHVEELRSGLNTPTEREGLWGIVHPFTHSEANKLAVQSFILGEHIGDRQEYNY